MPRNPVEPRRMELLTLEERLAQPRRCQEHWYALAGSLLRGKSVLDVGAGTGEGLAMLRACGCDARGIDPLPAGEGVARFDVVQLADKTWDAVTCMDVIEHVEDDAGLLREMLRVARDSVFISTPLFTTMRPIGEFHVREYAPPELAALLNGLTYQIWSIAEAQTGRERHVFSCDRLENRPHDIAWGIMVEVPR